MIILLSFAFVSGLLTILSPCIWPILPIVLSYSAIGGKRKPLGITLGIIFSFTFFTLSLSYLVKLISIDPNFLRNVAVAFLLLTGITFLIPPLSAFVESIVSRLSGIYGNKIPNKSGLWGGFIAGVAIGVLWSPCAGPILATIATTAATRQVNFQIILLTLVYMSGVGIPLFVFSTFGSHLLSKGKFLSAYTGRIQQFFGVLMIMTSIVIITNYDKVLQVQLLTQYPAFSNIFYGLEQNDKVQSELNRISNRTDSFTAKSLSLANLGPAPDFFGNWIDGNQISITSLRGNVVLVDFWTYSCINCIRTIPFVEGWYEKYRGDGFVVIGVHSPEFEFEKNTQNVTNAIKMFGITYPVVQDNDLITWNRFNNVYWPAKYLIDKDGIIRYVHFGEGRYAETEEAIKMLLGQSGKNVSSELIKLPDQTPTNLLTQETYLGFKRMSNYSMDPQPVLGLTKYSPPKYIQQNMFSFDGEWYVTDEYAESENNSSLSLNFVGSKVFLVITPSGNDDITVYLDESPVGTENAGKDVVNGKIQLDVPRLYELIDLKGRTEGRLLRLDFKEKGTRVFAFTFG